MKLLGKALSMCILTVLIAGIALTAGGPDRSLVSPPEHIGQSEIYLKSVTGLNSGEKSRANYNCLLKVFMVEQTSRWATADGKHYENALLSFAFDTSLSLAYQETYQETKVYDIGWTGWVVNNPDSVLVNQDNMMAIAVLYNDEVSGTGYSDPFFENPTGNPFDIHYVDAAAAATHDNPGWDTAYGDYTHTVFIEESSSHT